MAIQLSEGRRGLYTIEEYSTYRGQFKDSAGDLIPLVANYEPLIYMKCLVNSHQFPVRPETGEQIMPYDEFMNRDFSQYPFECPACGQKSLVFKWCELEDQPRTWNDSNHRFIKELRWITSHPRSVHYERDFWHIARPEWEDYFAPDHTNHNDPFAEHEIKYRSDKSNFLEHSPINDAISAEPAIPVADIYDGSGTYLITRRGAEFPGHYGHIAYEGLYTDIKKNYDFYRAILFIKTQLEYAP